MNTTALTPTQQAVLARAAQASDGKIDWFPDSIKGGARQKVLGGLFRRALITTDGSDWFVAAEGYDALGIARPAAHAVTATLAVDATLEQDVAAAEANWQAASKAAPRTRANSKQAQVIAMLERREGATIAQLCAATGWQSHTVRGTLAGALKKKLGLAISSEKPEGAERIYRIGSVQ
jgi:hypothetical protein